jgi:hypothetical protein
MACACKVNEQLKKIQKQYGVSKPMIKTNMKENLKIFFYKILVFILCLPFVPLITLFLVFRKIITNKPISISRFINIIRNVRK